MTARLPLAAALALLLASTAARADGLAPRCLSAPGAGHLRCPAAPPAVARPASGDLSGLWGLYRALGRSEVRRCRLEPTCSLFAVQAVGRLGVIAGALSALARVQMEHAAQGGALRLRLASDGAAVWLDPVALWWRP